VPKLPTTGKDKPQEPEKRQKKPAANDKAAEDSGEQSSGDDSKQVYSS
jgi:hypothetical protein